MARHTGFGGVAVLSDNAETPVELYDGSDILDWEHQLTIDDVPFNGKDDEWEESTGGHKSWTCSFTRAIAADYDTPCNVGDTVNIVLHSGIDIESAADAPEFGHGLGIVTGVEDDSGSNSRETEKISIQGSGEWTPGAAA